MAPLTTERRAALLAYCKLTEFAEDPEVTALLETLYGAALAYMENLGITDGYRQDSSSAREEYTPDFDLGGI